MTVDDDKSIYVGGLPYECTEETLRRTFDIYGHIVAVKIINDREVGGKCYGFVTFKNPRSAVEAISEMNGGTIGGRVVRVNEVRTRGGRQGFGRENFRRDFGRDADWNRDKERDHFRDRDRYRDRNNDRFEDHDRDREREYEHGREPRDYDRSREHSLDQERDRDHEREDIDQEEGRSHGRKWEREDEMDWDDEGERKKRKEQDRSKENEREQPPGRLRRGRFGNQRGKDSSSSSGDEYQDEVRDKVQIAFEKVEDLQKQVADLQDEIEKKEKHVLDLQKKSQKLEEALVVAKKVSSQQKSRLTKILKVVSQVQDCTDKLKTSELELQALMEDTKFAVDGEDNELDDSLYKNISL